MPQNPGHLYLLLPDSSCCVDGGFQREAGRRLDLPKGTIPIYGNR